MIGWVVVATQLAAGEIERSRTEGSERFEQLAKARILAQQARTDETLELIARGDITAGEKSFNGHIDELGKLLDAAPAAAKDGVQKWIASHRKQVEAYKGGDYLAAVAQAIERRSGRFCRAVRRRRIQLARRDRANARHDARSSVRGGRMAGVESHGDSCADGRRCVSGRRRVVAATQGVPVRTRIVLVLFAVALSRCRMWILRSAGISVGLAGRTVAGRCDGVHGDRASGGKCGLRSGSQPAARSAAVRRVPCRRVRRWRRSPSVDDSSSGVDQNTVSVRLPEPGHRATGGLRHRHRPRDRARHLRRSRPHPAASGQCEPTRIGVAVRRGRRGGADLLDHL